jgi:hypothetical protein
MLFHGAIINVTSFTPISTFVPTPDVLQLPSAQQQYVQTCCVGFHQDGDKNAEGTDINQLMSLRSVRLPLGQFVLPLTIT